MQPFEPLESRRMMDATAPYVINGTPGDDVITVSYSPPPVIQTVRGGLGGINSRARLNSVFAGDMTYVTVNGVTTVASIGQSQAIKINGLDGHDLIRFTGNHAVEIRGGAGNDTIFGGARNDAIFGDAGNDQIDAGAGDDTVRGGAGDDVSRGGTGKDVLYADSGNDQLFGDAHDDRLYGGTGADLLYGGDGADILVTIGGGQSDRAWGGAGNDSFWVDKAAGERIEDANLSEMSINLHYVSSYAKLNVNGVPASQLIFGQHPIRKGAPISLPDPHAWDVPYRSFAGRPLFNAGGPHADDIDQNNLGDCYFLAGLSAVAKTAPNTIKQSVVDLGDGTFAVRFYDKQKVQHYLRVDADLPAWSEGSPAYAGLGVGGAMWGPILEKAFAFFRKNHGSYGSIVGGWPEHTYQALGLRTTIHASTTMNTPQKMVDAILDLRSKGNAVSFVTRQDATVLAGLHVYSVDRVFNDAQGNAHVVLRNPWKTDGPSGDGVEDGYVTLRADVLFAAYDQVAGGRM